VRKKRLRNTLRNDLNYAVESDPPGEPESRH